MFALKHKHLYFLFALSIFLIIFSFSQKAFAEELIDDLYLVEGYQTVSGNGTLFQVNIGADSILEFKTQTSVDLRIDASDKMIIIENEPSETEITTAITISNLHPSTTYYKYSDSYLNLEEITTDATGSLTYQQDVSDFHSVFIQTTKSTKIISPTSTGGSCSSIGTWDNSTKTCTLTQDVFETIQINGDGITLDGAGHTVQGSSVGFGVYVPQQSNVAVKNLVIKGFFWGINATQASQSNFSNNILENNVRGGILFSSSQNITLQNNQLIDDDFYVTGNMVSHYTHSIDISNTIDGKSILYLVNAHDEEYREMSVNAFYCIACNNVLFEGSIFTANDAHIVLYKTNSTVIKNVELQSDTSYISLENSTLNTIEGNIVNRFYNQGIVLFSSTENRIAYNTLTGSEPIALFSSNDNLVEYNNTSGSSSGIYLSGSNSNIIRLNESHSGKWGVNLNHRSTLNELYDNTFRENTYGIGLFFRSSNGNLIYNNNFIDNQDAIYNDGTTNQVFDKPLPIGGNYWSQFDEDSEGCQDADNNNICDTQFSLGDAGNNVDNFVWKVLDGWKEEIQSSEKAISSFNFQSLTPVVEGVINETDHTIFLTVPFGTDVTTLVPTITSSSGASVSPDNNIFQNFSTPVAYTVTAENGSTQVYTVTVVVATHTPVLIIPGVLGTEISKTTDTGPEKLWLDIAKNLTDIGDQFMDALQFNSDLTPTDTSLTLGDVIRKITFLKISYDYSDGLIKEFESQGYIEGTDLFLFPYDWRYGVNEDNVNKLKQKIVDVLDQTSSDEVDIIAHSTGGLLVKKYVVENPEDNHIDKAVFVGVPNTGAPKAFKVLIQGDGFGVPLLADSEMKKISANFPVAYDLSPSEQYFNVKGSYAKIIDQYNLSNKIRDLDFEESNVFLINDHKLNAQALVNAHNLHTTDFDNYDLRTAGIDLYAVNGCKAGTIGKFIEARYHGLLGGDDYIVNNFKIEEIPGDGTVPLESATNLPIDIENKFYALKGKHSTMLTQDGTRQKIVNIISGSALSTQDTITQDISECKLNGRAVSVFSPLSIDIMDQDGNHAGLASDGVSIENNIPNADFQIIGDHKFVYLPTDEGQTYTISVAGTGTGTFTLTDATITEDNIIQTQVFSDISVTPSLLGHINLSSTTTLSLDTNGDGIIDQTLEPTSILDAEQSQDFVPEPPDDNTSPNSSESSSQSSISSGSSRRREAIALITPEDDIAVEEADDETIPPAGVATETPVENQVAQQDDTLVANTQIIQNTESASLPALAKDFSQENSLTANVVDSETPISSTIIVILAGIIGILLIAKNFIKL